MDAAEVGRTIVNAIRFYERAARAKEPPAIEASYTNLCPGGPIARTVPVGDSFNFDVDAEGRIVGVETIGDDADWTPALTLLAMEGRVVIRPPGPQD